MAGTARPGEDDGRSAWEEPHGEAVHRVRVVCTGTLRRSALDLARFAKKAPQVLFRRIGSRLLKASAVMARIS